MDGQPQLHAMVYRWTRVIGAALLGFWPNWGMAQEASASDVFARTAQAAPKQALGAAYAFGNDAPTVMVAGPRSRADGRKVPPDAPFHIGSISKSFTATLLMQLEQEGQLSLSTPIGAYLNGPEYQLHPTWAALTLEQLLSHTAGLKANASMREMIQRYAERPAAGRVRVLSALWQSPVPHRAGKMRYSNLGYVLAGVVAEEVTGQSWEDQIQARFGRRLGLKSLGFGAPDTPDAPLGHVSIVGVKKPLAADLREADNPAWMGPAGTIHLNMADLARWGQTHLRACRGEVPRFLTVQNCRRLWTPVSKNYGLGWIIEQPKGLGPKRWHNGSNNRWFAVLAVYPEQDLVVATASNHATAQRVTKLEEKMARALVAGAR